MSLILFVTVVVHTAFLQHTDHEAVKSTLHATAYSNTGTVKYTVDDVQYSSVQ